MTRTKRLPASGQAGLVATFQQIRANPDVPTGVQLRAIDEPFWRTILASRAPDEWAPSDLPNAALLARTQADIERGGPAQSDRVPGVLK